jgi:hypothetical protein
MDEWLYSPPAAGPWTPAAERTVPLGDDLSRGLGGDLACGCGAAVADVIAVIGDTRRLTQVAAGLLAAVLVGAATLGAALVGRGHVLAVGSVALLLPVAVSWLVTAALVLSSEVPVTRALGQLRQVSGAPLDLAAPWTPVGLRPLTDTEGNWGYVVSLIAAATHRHARARIALGGAVVTTAVFLAWMSLALVAVTVP